MNTKAAKQESNENLRKKFIAALALLLISVILLLTTTMAWLVLSRAPEVTGIATNIGANGALEIALLNKETYLNPNNVKTLAGGQSLSVNKVTANYTWGNLIDLSDKSFGLGKINLLPSRLNIVKKEASDGYTINSGMLSVPSYAYDGRIEKLTDNTTTATYNNSKFSNNLKEQNYGVRAIGTSDALSVQSSSLVIAQTQIPTLTKGALNNASSVLSNDVKDLLTSLVMSYMSDNPTFGDTDVEILKSIITGLQSSESNIEQALRQGLIAVAASKIGDENTFIEARNIITDSSKSLSEILEDLGQYEKVVLHKDFVTWVEQHKQLKNSLKAAKASCDTLQGGTYTKQQFTDVLNNVMNISQVLLNDTPISKLSKDDAAGLLKSKDNTMLMKPGSGAFAIIADFTGNYSATISFSGTNINIMTASAENPAYLVVLNEYVIPLTAANNSSAGGEIELTTTYGYAIDLAFRTNAQVSNLLLQTAAVQRINEESTSTATMGGGSYMEFDTSIMGTEDTLRLMDAVRVGFVDNKGDVLAIAKLNSSNYVFDNDGIAKAPLYLYDYSISEDPESKGALIMGERRKSKNTITPLTQNLPKTITAIVWLDGDIVDNTMVPAEEEFLSGVLNLQFTSDANLNPYVSSQLLSYTTDKTGLMQAVADYKEIYTEGQKLYTTLSWNEFTVAYNKAVAIEKSVTSNDSQVYHALINLNSARNNLKVVEPILLKEKIDEVRELMGKTEDKVYVITKETTTNDKNEKVTVYKKNNASFTQAQLKNNVGVVYRVDYDKNLKDEGNDVKTRIYTDASWTALANVLYDAEATFYNKNATNAEIDAALLTLETAYTSLQCAVYYIPCDLNGELYYYALSDDSDTYGKWYDSSFKRIISDMKIFELDAYAEKDTEIVDFDRYYIPCNEDVGNLAVNMLDEVYPSLANEKLIAAHWKLPSEVEIAMTAYQKTRLEELLQLLDSKEKELKTAAEKILEAYPHVSYDRAYDIISQIEKAVPDVSGGGGGGADYITANQKLVLAKAITSAKSVKDYDNAENNDSKLENLRSKVADAEEVLANDEATVVKAQEVIVALNVCLKDFGIPEVNEENTVTYPLPEGSDVEELWYVVNNPTPNFIMDDTTVADVVFDAVLLTKNGIIIKVKKNIEIYSPAEDVEITNKSKSELKKDEDLKLEWAFVNRVDKDDKEIVHSEKISESEWSSSDTSVLTVSENGDVTAVGEGTATIWIRVETKQGNSYSDSISITVPKPIEPPVTE